LASPIRKNFKFSVHALKVYLYTAFIFQLAPPSLVSHLHSMVPGAFFFSPVSGVLLRYDSDDPAPDGFDYAAIPCCALTVP